MELFQTFSMIVTIIFLLVEGKYVHKILTTRETDELYSADVITNTVEWKDRFSEIAFIILASTVLGCYSVIYAIIQLLLFSFVAFIVLMVPLGKKPITNKLCGFKDLLHLAKEDMKVEANAESERRNIYSYILGVIFISLIAIQIWCLIA